MVRISSRLVKFQTFVISILHATSSIHVSSARNKGILVTATVAVLALLTVQEAAVSHVPPHHVFSALEARGCSCPKELSTDALRD